jgi:hypothetical protein
MPAKSPEERSLVSRIGGYEKWAQTADRTAATQAARRAFNKRFDQYPIPSPPVRLTSLVSRWRARRLAARRLRREARKRSPPPAGGRGLHRRW